MIIHQTLQLPRRSREGLGGYVTIVIDMTWSHNVINQYKENEAEVFKMEFPT